MYLSIVCWREIEIEFSRSLSRLSTSTSIARDLPWLSLRTSLQFYHLHLPSECKWNLRKTWDDPPHWLDANYTRDDAAWTHSDSPESRFCLPRKESRNVWHKIYHSREVHCEMCPETNAGSKAQGQWQRRREIVQPNGLTSRTTKMSPESVLRS